MIWYERRVSMWQRFRFLKKPWEGNQVVLEWRWCNYERNPISWMLQLAGKWPHWSKHPQMHLFVSVTLSIQHKQMKYLKGASVLNLHCNTTWEKSFFLVPVKHAPKPFSITEALLDHTLLGLWPSLGWVSSVLPSTGALRMGGELQTGNGDPWHWTRGVPSLRALCFSERTATVSFSPTRESQPVLEQKSWPEQ